MKRGKCSAKAANHQVCWRCVGGVVRYGRLCECVWVCGWGWGGICGLVCVCVCPCVYVCAGKYVLNGKQTKINTLTKTVRAIIKSTTN